MKIFVVSLPQAHTRRAAMSRQFNELGLNYEFVDGVKITTLSEESTTGYDEKSRIYRYGYGLTSGEIGCFLAHKRAWEAVKTRGERCLVLEDDVLLSGLTEHIIRSLQESPYSLVRVAGIFTKRYKPEDGGGYAKYWGDPSGAAGYVLGPKEAARLLEKSHRFHMAVDDFMEAHYLHGLYTVALLPYPVKHCGGHESEIGDRRRPKLSKWVRFRIMRLRVRIDFFKYFHRIKYYFF